MDIAALATELTTDPTARGYAAPLGQGALGVVAALLNARQAGISVSRGIIQGVDVIAALDATELAALTTAQVARLQLLTSASGGVDTGAVNTRNILAALFAAGTASRTALIALATRQGSRAEQLFGPGVTVGHEDIAHALGRY